MSRPPFHLRLRDGLNRATQAIGDAWWRFVRPLERAFGSVGESLLGAFDSFEGLESLVFRMVRPLFWPFAAIGRLGWRALPAESTARLTDSVGRSAGRAATLLERLNLDGVVRWGVWLATPAWWPMASLLAFLRAWLATRRPREMALAVPALVLAAPFVFVGLSGAKLSRNQIAERYKIAVREATEEADYARVDRLERKLAQLGIDTRRGEYRVAVALAEADDLAGAYQRMKRLAPEDAPGYLPAQAWIVQQLVTGGLTAEHEPALADGEPAMLALAEKRLDQLEAAGASPASVARTRAFLLVRGGKLREAVDVLGPLAENDPEAGALRMQLLAQLKDLNGARRQARAVLAAFADRRGDARRDAQPVDYAAWLLAAQLRADEAQLVAALEAWLEAEPDEKRPREVAGAYRRDRADRLLADETAAPEKVAEAIIEAMRGDPPPRWIGQLTASMARRRMASRRVQEVWRRVLDRPGSPAALAEALGTAAAASGDVIEARAVFERIVAGGAISGVGWNNYAWTLLQPPHPDPAAALEAVRHALAESPREFRFRETRGQALVQLERWEEAVEDLEYALNGLPESVEVHRSLARAYDALDNPQLAETHRLRAGF